MTTTAVKKDTAPDYASAIREVASRRRVTAYALAKCYPAPETNELRDRVETRLAVVFAALGED